MARSKALPMPQPLQPDPEVIDALVAGASAGPAAAHEERDLVNQLLGQAQMADAFGQFSLTVRTSKLAFVKENKLYRALKGKKSPDGQGFLMGNWEEFCNLLGRSVAQTDEDIANLKALGEHALESMSRMGIGYRELRQFRKLPDDQKQALIEAAQTGDRDQLEDLAEELLAKHEREKQQLKKQHDDAVRDLETARNLNAEKAQQLDEVKAQLHRRKFDREPWKQDVRDAVQEIATAQATAVEALARLAAMREALMQNNELSEEAHDYAVRCLVAETQYTAQQAAQVWMDTQTVYGNYLDMPLPAMEVLEQLADEQGA